MPSWWSPDDERLATVVVPWAGERRGAFRLHWEDGWINGLGGGAVVEPVSTLFAPIRANAFLGYHLGIRRPVRMTFDVAPNGDIPALRLSTPAASLRAAG